MDKFEEKLEDNVQAYFDALKQNVGKKIKVKHVWYGVLQETEGTLRNVEDYINIEIEGMEIPFIGYGAAIIKIIDGNEKVLYENPLIPVNYDVRRWNEIDYFKFLAFGEDVSNRFEEQRVAEENEWKKRVTEINKKAQENSLHFIVLGEKIVKPELRKEWKKHAKQNTENGYSAAVIEAFLKVGYALTDGKTPEEAEKEVDESGITGFQMGCVARSIAYFHPRGEEFRNYWNGQFLSEGEAEKTKGIVNPAIWTIEEKE